MDALNRQWYDCCPPRYHLMHFASSFLRADKQCFRSLQVPPRPDACIPAGQFHSVFDYPSSPKCSKNRLCLADVIMAHCQDRRNNYSSRAPAVQVYVAIVLCRVLFLCLLFPSVSYMRFVGRLALGVWLSFCQLLCVLVPQNEYVIYAILWRWIWKWAPRRGNIPVET